MEIIILEKELKNLFLILKLVEFVLLLIIELFYLTKVQKNQYLFQIIKMISIKYMLMEN